MSEEYFEQIYKGITNDPRKAILIFDGLDELHGDPINCIEQSRKIPNDPNNELSAMNLCIKLILGDLLKGATILVTSRPTADDFYSKLDFDRNVEIIGFTSDKIEEYVSRFCENNEKREHEHLILNHIQSSSELSNLCYIPVNCFIVCVTLSECLMSESRRTALPTTLTELYQTAINYFEKYHHRTDDGNDVRREILSKLQELAFRGLENDQLVFNEESFEEQLRNSGLVNSLSNPIFPLKTQFCFIHLTIQEFLAAKHATETLAPTSKLKRFITDHVKCAKWHLVLQFVAGLVGKKNNMTTMEFKECLLAFSESIEVVNGRISVSKYHHNGFVMKCLKEVDNENIVKDVLETNEISGEMNLLVDYTTSPNECAEIAFGANIMNNLVNLKGASLKNNIFRKVLEFLRQRCVKGLHLINLDSDIDKMLEGLFSTLAETECKINHAHSKLTELEISYIQKTDADLSSMIDFFRKGHASQLERLILKSNGINLRQIENLCEVFNDDHCTKLTQLSLSDNPIGSERIRWDFLLKGLSKLTKLDVSKCDLDINSLFESRITCNQLTDLDISTNKTFRDDSLCPFKECLTNEQCKLTKLSLENCSLTATFIPSLCDVLQNERC